MSSLFSLRIGLFKLFGIYKELSLHIKNVTYVPYKKHRFNRKRERFLVNGKKLVARFDKAMKEAGIDYWLFFGTLLGAVREGGVIKHDFDFDVGVMFKDYSDDLESILKRQGFKKTRQFLVDGGQYAIEQTYEYCGVLIDIFYFHVDSERMYCHLFSSVDANGNKVDVEKRGGYIVRELSYPIFSLVGMPFLGVDAFIPNNYHDVLMADYGADYMIPDENYVARPRKNVTYLDNKLGIKIKY